MVASLAMLSLLSLFLPLSRASADNSGVKACCIGKAGHDSGSCSTGLLKAANVEFHVNLLVERTAKKKLFANVKAGAGADGHCGSQASSTDEIEAASAAPIEDASEALSEAAAEPPLNIHAVSNTCPNECGTCSVSYTRRPRPREQSTLSSVVRSPSTPLIRLIVSDQCSVRELNFKWSQSPSRAPPAYLV